MRLLFRSLDKELRRQVRDPLAMALWLGIPLTIMTLMNLAFGGRAGQGSPVRGILLLADEDQSIVSGMVSNAFTQGPMADLFRLEKMSQQEGRRRMAKGEASALVIVPKGFQQAVLLDQPVTIRLVTNPTQQIAPAIAGETLTILAEGNHYLHMIAGDQLKELAGASGEMGIAQLANAIGLVDRLNKSLSRYLDPPLLSIETKVEKKTEDRPFNFVALVFPGIVFMSVLFLARGMSEDYWEEKLSGTLRRVVGTNVGLGTFLGAKLLGTLVLSTAVAGLALAAGHWGMGLEVASWPAAGLWLVVSAGVWYLALFNVQLLAASRATGAMLSSLIVFPSMMLGGSMFAFEMMPSGMAAIAQRTPLGWMVLCFTAILRGVFSASEVAGYMAALAGLGAALFVLTSWHLRRRCAGG